MEIYEEGKIALVRMESEIHNAIPNAIDVTAGPPSVLQFGIIDEVTMRSVFGRYNENPPTNQITDLFVLPPISDATAFLPINSIISIYNRSWNDFTTAPRRLYQVTGVTVSSMNLSANIPPPKSSPLKRYYAVDKAIRYRLTGDTLNRSVAPVTTGGVGAYANDYPLAKKVTPLIFSYTPASLTRNAIVTINFTITKGGESVDFHKEVHIKNVP
jgi:MSHA biogenesis protein MshO